MPFETILTERLKLRELEPSDAQRIVEYRSRPEVSRFQSWGTQSRHEIESSIRGLSSTQPGVPGHWYQLGITVSSRR